MAHLTIVAAAFGFVSQRDPPSRTEAAPFLPRGGGRRGRCPWPGQSLWGWLPPESWPPGCAQVLSATSPQLLPCALHLFVPHTSPRFSTAGSSSSAQTQLCCRPPPLQDRSARVWPWLSFLQKDLLVLGLPQPRLQTPPLLGLSLAQSLSSLNFSRKQCPRLALVPESHLQQ